MTKQHQFARNEVFPSWFVNAVQEYIAGELRLSRLNATNVRVAPREPFAQATVNLQGRYRYRTTNVDRAHPGGVAGTYAVWAVALDTVINNVPDPFTDHTDYSFDLRITAGADPSGAGVEVFEKIGEVDWDGAAITAVRQTYGSVSGALLETGAVVGSGRVSVARQPDGSLLLDLVDAGIPEAKLADLSVSTRTLQALAVTAAKIANAAVGSAQLADGSVVTSKVNLLAITTALINDLAVTTGKIADAAVTSAKLGANSVVTAAIADLNVTTAKLGDLAVTAAKIANGTITEAKMAALSVGTPELIDLAVTTAKLAAQAVTSAKIANLAVGTAQLADLGVTGAKLAAGAVTPDKMAFYRGVKFASASLTLTTSEQAITGLSHTATRDGSYMVWAAIDFWVTVANPGVCTARPAVNGVGQGGIFATFDPGAGVVDNVGRATAAGVWFVNLTAGQTLTIVAKKAINAGTAQAGVNNSSLLYQEQPAFA